LSVRPDYRKIILADSRCFCSESVESDSTGITDCLKHDRANRKRTEEADMGSTVTGYTESNAVSEGIGNSPALESVLDGPLEEIETSTPANAKREVVIPEAVCEDKGKETQQKLRLVAEIRDGRHFDAIVGESPALKTALQLVSVVAPVNASVMILGETGTGKELIARAIHDLSTRRDRAFVKLNCAAIPLGLLESELFGHEKGAFTGAIAQKIGRFELANKGTLFLDEVGDIPLELQAKLLRVLQEQEFERLGSNQTHKVDVRVIAATHRDLVSMVKQTTFREDLYYRLKVFPINIPPLRQRAEDIPILARHFTALYARRMNKSIGEIPLETIDALVQYRWPGNIRELQNFIERAVILSPHTVLRAPISELEPFCGRERFNMPISGLEEVRRDHILHALEASNWVVGGRNGAAARLGMQRTSLLYKMRKLRLSRPAPSQPKRAIESRARFD
jgi:formate hydrogenlyase transcriptional activator